MSLQHALSGGSGLLLNYCTVWGGWVTGLVVRKAPTRLYLFSPIAAAVLFVVAGLAWTVIVAMEPRPLSFPVEFFFSLVFAFVFAVLAALVLARIHSPPGHVRGAQVVEERSATAARPSGTLTLAGEPIPPSDETKHFKLIGTTGTGKSTAIRELLGGALARGDRAVIADPDGSYLKVFYTPERGDVILNPFDARSARWDLFAEIERPHEADQLARSLIPDAPGNDRVWRNYGRTFTSALLRQLHQARTTDIAKLYYLVQAAPVPKLRELLELTPAAPFLAEDNQTFFGSVRSVASTHLAFLEHIADQQDGHPFSVRRWVRESKTGVLFLPYRAGEIASLRQVISTWMRLAIFETMNGEERDQRLWFAIDELDALGPIDGLKDALARLRKFGGRGVIGLQSIGQLRGTYPGTEAETITENCGTTVILRCSASEHGGTSEFASRLIGKREVLRRTESETRSTFGSKGGPQTTRTRSEQPHLEDAILPSEIEQLADLQGFLKVASRPEWRRIRIEPRQWPKLAERFIPRAR